MRLRFQVPVIALLAFTVGCDDDRPKSLPLAPAEVAADELSAYLVVSDPAPAIGSRFTVAVRTRRGSAVGPVGSFTMRIGYDTTQVRFLEAGRSEAGMVMANGARAGVVVAAGASATGFTEDELFVATFTAVAAGATESLALTVSELNSVSFQNQRDQVRVPRQLFHDTRLRK